MIDDEMYLRVSKAQSSNPRHTTHIFRSISNMTTAAAGSYDMLHFSPILLGLHNKLTSVEETFQHKKDSPLSLQHIPPLYRPEKLIYYRK